MTAVVRAAASALAIGAVLTGAGYVVVPAAQAAPGDPGDGGRLIGLSSDGQNWSDALDAPLFDAAVRWVPGDVRTARFWVRNQAPSTGDVAVRFSPTVTLTTVDAQALRVMARAGAGPWIDVKGAEADDLLTGRGLDVGQATSVELQVQMRRDAPNTAMVLSTGLDLDVTVADALASGPVPPDARLPQTGSVVPVWAGPVAGGLVVAGAALLLVAARRRSRSGPRAVPAA